MVAYTLVQRWEILEHYYENHGNVAECKIIFSDEARFDLGGYVNKQNCRISGTESPPTYHCLMRILVQRHNWAIFLRK